MAECRSLPVLMYHYITHYSGPIAVSPENFEKHCRSMAECGWHGISLADAESFFLDGRPLPAKSVLISFDDGFLDNYVYAYPILKKYGHKGVIFAVTERLEKNNLKRPTLDDVWCGRMTAQDLPHVDDLMHKDSFGFDQRRDLFLSWEEARILEKSGIISIAAHTANHFAVYAAPDFKEIRKPASHGNTFYLVDAPMLWGLPKFKERPALYCPAFLPSATLLDAIRSLVPQDTEAAKEFFRNPDQEKRLMALLAQYAPADMGSLESDSARAARVKTELQTCASTLAEQLGHPVRSLCWPWGRGSDIARTEAQKLGFSVFFETRMGANPPGAALAVHRFKVRDRGWLWLRSRLEIYSRPWLAIAYAKTRI